MPTGGNRSSTANKRIRISLVKSGAIKCSRCKPHRGENKTHEKKRSDRYKDHRAGGSKMEDFRYLNCIQEFLESVDDGIDLMPYEDLVAREDIPENDEWQDFWNRIL